MRKDIGIERQLMFGQTDILEIKIDPRCRDEIPQLLKGLQAMYARSKIREEIFRILRKAIPANAIDKGRPGMHLWQILVLALFRVNCNWDWDKIIPHDEKVFSIFEEHTEWISKGKADRKSVV